MSLSQLLSVRWRQWGIALAVALGSFAAVPALAQVDTNTLVNLVPSLNLTFDRTTCLNICEESGRTCPATDRTCGDSYITCRTQCFKGVSATPKPVATAPVQAPTTQTQQGTPQLISSPLTPGTVVVGSSDLNDRIAALEALIIKYISLCQAGSCCAIGQQVQQPIVVGTSPSPTPNPTSGTQPTFDLSPIGTVQQPGAVTTAPQSCADCAKLAAGATKTQCEAAFKCTTPPITLVSPPPVLPNSPGTTPKPSTPSVSTPITNPPAASVPGVGTLPGGVSITPTANFFTPFQSWSDSCKASCQSNVQFKTQVQKDQCKVDNCSVSQYKSSCSAWCKANNSNTTLAGQCAAKC